MSNDLECCWDAIRPLVIAILGCLVLFVSAVASHAAPAPGAPTTAISGLGTPAMTRTETKVSYVDAFVNASTSYDCWELTFNGVCIHTFGRINLVCASLVCYPEPEIGIHASLEFSHYIPDLLLATYTRLGASPLDVAKALYGEFQNIVTAPMIGAIAGNQGAPATYSREDLWAGRSGETQGSSGAGGKDHKTTLKFNETDAIGHPGNVLSYWNRLVNGQEGGALKMIGGSATDVVGNVIGGTMDMARAVPAKVEQAVTDVKTNVVGNPDRVDILNSQTGWEEIPEWFSMQKMALLQFLPDTVQNILAVWKQLQSYFQAWTQALQTGDSIQKLQVLLGGDVLQNIVNEIMASSEILGIVETMQEHWEQIQDIVDAAEGGGGVTFEFNEQIHMCLTDAEVLRPYFLSGLDMLQWKFNIPEMVFPESYALPFGAKKAEKFIGVPESKEEAGLIPLLAGIGNNWGPIYPRNGFESHVDGMKVGAVTSVRAVHVVTNPGQYHVYNYLDEIEREPNKKGTKNYRTVHPSSFDLTDRETGKWQLLGDKGTGCFNKFGDGDFTRFGTTIDLPGPLADLAGSKVPWSEGKTSDDDAYVYTLWRKYTCCPAPNWKSKTIMQVYDYVTTIPLKITLI